VLVWELCLVWNTLLWGSKCNCTLQFQHLNLIWVNTKHHSALWTFKSFPGLLLAEHTPHCIYLPFWGQWSLTIFTLNELVEGVGLSHGVVWGCTPLTCVILWIRGARGWPCFSLKAFSKVPFTWNTTARDLCSKLHTYISLILTATCISSFTVWCNKALQHLPVYLTSSQVIEKNVYYQTLIVWTATETGSYQQNVIWDWLVSTPQKFLAHNIALVKTRAFKTLHS